MIKVQEIKELIRALDQSTVDELTYEQSGTKLTLKKTDKEVYNEEVVVRTVQQPETKVEVREQKPEKAVAAKAPERKEEPKDIPEDAHTITSPMVGTFYVAPSPESDPYVKIGDEVQEDTIVCIVEAMKLMNEIEAEIEGTIVDVLAENGELVEYGQPLFVVEPK